MIKSDIDSQARVIHAPARGGPIEIGMAAFGGGDSQVQDGVARTGL
jgi:hypothetical protein